MLYKQIKNNSIIMIEMSSTNKNDSLAFGKNDSLALCKNDKTCELSTLSTIIDLSKECTEFLDLLQDKRRKILLDIQKNENDFFEKNPLIISQFNALFDPSLYKSKVKIFMEELEDTVDSYCCHDYVEDLIDTDYDQSKRIVYCQLCELTKK
jgi:hypothetical protein